MSSDSDDTSETTENDSDTGSAAGTDHMAEMAAAMAADATADSTAGTDHMAEMAAAIAADATADSAVAAQPVSGEGTAESIAREVSGKDVNIEALLKVPVSLSIEVGRTQMILSDLLETQEGSVIELERLLEEPLDILVNGALIAHGIVVLANERFGLQITDIISLEERARSL